MPAKIVPTARLRPGKCILSGETNGPFLDTGSNIPRYGQVYISIKWLKPALVDSGLMLNEDTDSLKEELKTLRNKLKGLEIIEAHHREMVNAMAGYLPEPEPEIVERKVVVTRDPTDEEIAEWIESRGGNHPVVRKARAPERGSSEEWQKLYNDKKPATPEADKLEELAEDLGAQLEDTGPSNVVELYGQQVDLDKVLAENTATISKFCQDKPEEFITALVKREHYLAEVKNKDPRKGVLEPLGYWDEDGALYPEEVS